MPQRSSRISGWASLDRIGLPVVPIETIDQEVSRWPLDALLGFLGRLSTTAMTIGHEFHADQRQQKFKAIARDDGFPFPLPDKALFDSENKGLPLAHTQNMAWLAHRALLHCPQDRVTPAFNQRMEMRFFRLLLLANSHLNSGNQGEPATLVERRQEALALLRHWQFSQTHNVDDAIRSMARQHTILLKHLPQTFDVVTAFQTVTGGIDLNVYFAVAYLLVLFPFTQQMTGKQKGDGAEISLGHWSSIPNHLEQLENHRDQAEQILRWWMTSPDNYNRSMTEWREAHPEADPRFDYVQLRATPLIEARPNEFVTPVAHFLIQKVVDDPYFIVSSNLNPSERNRFQQELGIAYEAYANELLLEIAQNDNQGPWRLYASPRLPGNDEVADALLVRGTVVIAFEHKALRPNLDFLLGIEGDRVLGPPDAALEILETRQMSLDELKDADKGLFTRPMNQQTRAEQKVRDFLTSRLSVTPSVVFPCISHLADAHIDSVANTIYLKPYIDKVNYYAGTAWQYPQWLHIQDLELLANLAKAGRLDLQALLQAKLEDQPLQALDEYLAREVETQGIPNDERTYRWLKSFTEEASLLLFPVSRAQHNL